MPYLHHSGLQLFDFRSNEELFNKTRVRLKINFVNSSYVCEYSLGKSNHEVFHT